MIRSCLILFFCFLYSGDIFPQKNADVKPVATRDSIRSIQISLVYKDVRLQKILSDISLDYSLNFSYAGSMIPLDTLMSFNVSQISLGSFLDILSERFAIEHSIIGIYIVLFRKTFYQEQKNKIKNIPADSAFKDTISLYPVKYAQNKNIPVLYKVSLWDIVSGAEITKDPVFIQNRDSVILVQKHDSLKIRDRQLYRKRVRLIRRKYRSNQWTTLSLHPEFSIWNMKGTTNQSIDYKLYNDYGGPDPGITLQTGHAIRVLGSFFIKPGLNASYQIKRGIHTDYYVSFLTPSFVEERSYRYDSRLIFSAFTLQAGYEHKAGKNKVTLSGGYFGAVLIRKTAPRYFPYFETKYYVAGPPYYNSNYERIRREEIRYRDWVMGVMADILFYRSIHQRFDLFAGIHARLQLHSIYTKEAQISERSLSEGVSIGVRYNMR